MAKKSDELFTCSCCGEDFNLIKKRRYCNSFSKRLKREVPMNSTERRMIRNKEFIKKARTKRECEICKYNKYPEALDFRHKNRNLKDISVNIISKTLKNTERIKKEVNKCVVVCRLSQRNI